MSDKRRFTVEFKRGPIQVMIALILVFTLGVLVIKLTHFSYRTSELKNEIHTQHKRAVLEQVDCAVDYIEFCREQEDGLLGKLGRENHQVDGTIEQAPWDSSLAGLDQPQTFDPHGHDFTQLIKDLVKPYFARFQFAQGRGYLFVTTYDGLDVVNSIQMGIAEQSEPDKTDDEKADLTQRVLKAAKLPHGAFVRMSDHQNDSHDLATQIVYVRGLKDFGWIVGAGLHVDEDNSNLAVMERASHIREMAIQLLVGMLICVLAIFLIYRVFQRTQIQLEKEFSTFKEFFKLAEEHGHRISPGLLNYSEFTDMARGVNRMLDARHEADAAFKQEHQRLETLLSVIPARVTFKSNDFKYLTANRVFCEWVGVDGRDIIDKTDFDLFPLEQADMHHADDCLIIYHHEDSVIREEELSSASGGEKKWYLSTKVPQRDSDGHVCGVVNIAMDISGQKRREQEVYEINGQLEQAMAQAAEYTEQMETLAEERARQLVHSDRLATLGVLSAGIAHEINNPIAFVSGNIRNLETFWPSIREVLISQPGYENDSQLSYICAEVPTMCQEMQKGIERIARIVDGLKTYARKEPTESKTLNINSCIENALELCRNRLKYNITIECHIDRDMPNIAGHDQELEQVFINLFVNAADAIEETSKGVLCINTYYEESQVCVTVEDSGPGFKPDTLDSLFTPFYTTKPPGKGTGLGLAITHSIVENHGGTIKAANRPEGGAQFILQFPAIEQESNSSGSVPDTCTAGLREE